ncbi:deoxyribose-phosphate aldolase [Eleftheria terrae]|uniref:deoxyribose-phosphate aldolase n=1 Tax=Eleftheria terrae TaxID=1597781 RepID=UPI00263BDAD0|nr:deoxyribose-phosphate aldolase [Eleftheria terrae]WKB53200.1 deoxyribose-phosphate aldolase [Eleftheria terrae]
MTARTPAEAALLALQCLDLTSLKDEDSDDSIRALAARAATPHGAPAALCVYPRFVPVARQALDAQGLTAVRVATVVNFPQGQRPASQVVAEIEGALAAGADEIDLVFPWRALLDGQPQVGAELVGAGRRACQRAGSPVPLKVILETGELRDPATILEAGRIAAAEGADFLKTSTGKVPVNATPEAVACLLQVINEHGGRVGLKIAGGVTGIADVQAYLDQVARACGDSWLTPEHLRFGASSLVGALLAALDGLPPPAAATPRAAY